MISTYQLKKGFQDILRPYSRALLSVGLTPNQVTFGTLVLCIVFALFLSSFSQTAQIFWLVPPFLLFRMALNAIDGMMAKEGGQESALGVFLNELGDVIADAVLFFSLCSVRAVRVEPMIVFTFMAVLSEMAGVVAVQTGASRRYDGPMGKSDRAVWMTLLAVLIATGVDSTFVFDLFLGIGSFALALTIWNRVKSALKKEG